MSVVVWSVYPPLMDTPHETTPSRGEPRAEGLKDGNEELDEGVRASLQRAVARRCFWGGVAWKLLWLKKHR